MNSAPIAERMRHIQPFHVMGLLARARALESTGRDIVHMEIGEPDFVTPAPIIEAGQRALAEGRTHYTPAMGLPALREAIAGFYAQRYGVEVDPGRIVITPGASGALMLALGVLVNPGDEVLMADPGYPCNRNFVRLYEGRPVSIPVGAETAWQLTPEVAAPHFGPHTRTMLLASPSNPTGTVVDEPGLRALSEQCRQRGVPLVVDEIYHGLVYDKPLQTALAVSDDLFVINSFSKYFGMTGWRLGWLVVPEAYVDAVDRLAQNIFLAAPTPAQHAALAAFEPQTLAILEQRRQAFQARRDFLLPALRELGFEIPRTPEGAFYLYADCSRFTDDSDAFARRLLEQAGVAVTPGLDFGNNQPERHLRFAYTTDQARLAEGLRRIADFLQRGEE